MGVGSMWKRGAAAVAFALIYSKLGSNNRNNKNKENRMEKLHVVLLVVFFAVLIWSAVFPYDYFTWVLEVAPGILALIIMALSFKRFQFTNFTYVLILMHCIVLFIGAKYTYARVPAFDWLADVFGWGRNNYDKLGHFAQGFFPAVVVRELILRLGIVDKKGWVPFFTVCICLAASAVYELIEWWAALLSKEAADSFLGAQGYVWDTQSDMLFCLIGAVCAFIFLSKAHNRAIFKHNQKIESA